MRLLDRTQPASLSVTPLSLQCDPDALLEGLCREDQPVLLDSAARGDWGRYTILTCQPMEVLTLADGELRTTGGAVLSADREALWTALREAMATVQTDSPGPGEGPPYGPGWFGYLGYEVGRCVERLPGRARRDTPLPDLRLAFHDAALVHDAADGHWWLTELHFADPLDGAGRTAEALRRITSAPPCTSNELARGTRPADPESHTHAGGVAPSACSKAARPTATFSLRAESNFTPDAYRRAVQRCVDYIAAGDIFQVNLSQRFTLARPASPATIYRCLRRRNPAAYAAYLAFAADGQNCAVLSSSPELFLRVRGRRVITRPIKGTRPRGAHAATDRSAAAELLASGKDNAELAMIIDLLRNDLGRVCRFGTVGVGEARRLETHPTVHHLVGTVEGELRDGVSPAELLRATFPGGSITGAPKIRAMEIIDELEGVARGVYTGCIGWIGITGDAEWNIAIRTIVCCGDRALVQAGGGVVADSTPDGEYRETLAKARALLDALAMAQQADAGEPD